jgi:hypothetical protein
MIMVQVHKVFKQHMALAQTLTMYDGICIELLQ